MRETGGTVYKEVVVFVIVGLHADMILVTESSPV